MACMGMLCGVWWLGAGCGWQCGEVVWFVVPQSIAMAMARWILILVVVVATVGVGAHVGEITEHRAGHDVGDQWKVGGGLTTGQQRIMVM